MKTDGDFQIYGDKMEECPDCHMNIMVCFQVDQYEYVCKCAGCSEWMDGKVVRLQDDEAAIAYWNGWVSDYGN